VKLLGYRIFDHDKAPILARKRPDVTTQIATRAYEIFEERGHHDGQADQDWLQAEIETKKATAGAK
jgi:H+-transporting ATPase